MDIARGEIGVQGSSPGDEKLNGAVLENRLRFSVTGRGRFERRNTKNVLSTNLQDFAARGENGNLRAEIHDRFDQRGRRFDDVLAIVDDQKQPPSADRARDVFGAK